MDLLAKSILGIAVLIIILFIVYYATRHISVSYVSKQSATEIVLSDLVKANPGSVVNITNVTPSLYQGSWHVVASVVTNATSPCPSYFIYSFDYPKYGLVNRTDNVYTENCRILGFVNGTSYTIGSYPEAITRVYNIGIPEISNMITTYGYQNIVAHAAYYENTSVNGNSYNGVWIVNYSVENPNYSVYVVLDQSNGTYVTSFNETR